MAPELLALVKHDCPVCDQLLPALDAAAAEGAPLRILSQSSPEQTAEQARRVGLRAVPAVDEELELSARFDPDAVPTVILLDGGEERARVEGLQRERLEELAREAGATLELDGLPAVRPGCASATRDPEVAARLAARRARAEGRIRSRAADHRRARGSDRGAASTAASPTGCRSCPPTPERVVAMLEHTTPRRRRTSSASLPPYGGEATVEKVAVNAVMAGCRARGAADRAGRGGGGVRASGSRSTAWWRPRIPPARWSSCPVRSPRRPG